MPTRDAFTVTGHDLDKSAPSAEVGVSGAITAANAATRRGVAATYYVRDHSGKVFGQVIADGRGGVPVILGPAYFAAGGLPQDGPPEPLHPRPASMNGKEPDMAPSTEAKPDPKPSQKATGGKSSPQKAAEASAKHNALDGKAKTEPKPKAEKKSAPAAGEKKKPAKTAAVEVLKKEGGPLHVDELVKRVLATKGVKLDGKTPAATIASMLATENKKSDGLFVRTDKATYALR